MKHSTDLLNVDIDYITEHFLASRFSYSTQALPVNVLFDTLIRPFGETEEKTSCIKWVKDPSRAVEHVVMGNTCRAGGQWVDNPVEASWDIGTLSYARMLSLPEYGFDQYYKEVEGEDLPFYLRPTRRQVADYLATYPSRVGISDSIYNAVRLSGGCRTPDGFHFTSHGISCKHLVLASGVFSELIPPRPLLRPLSSLSAMPRDLTERPILVVGSGFSAADVIISTPPHQMIVHIFKWDPLKAPSPLKACHDQAYPEYAGVYRRMKFAALSSSSSRDKRPRPTRRRSSAFDLSRDWATNYEGLPNTEIIDVQLFSSHAMVTLRNDTQEIFQRQISRLAYVVGRRGSLQYLDLELLGEIGISEAASRLTSGQTLRSKISEDLEVAKDVFVIGSLTGDSLVRFAYGSCAYAAGKIISNESSLKQSHNGVTTNSAIRPQTTSCDVCNKSVMNGLDGHNEDARWSSDEHRSLDRRKHECKCEERIPVVDIEPYT